MGIDETTKKQISKMSNRELSALNRQLNKESRGEGSNKFVHQHEFWRGYVKDIRREYKKRNLGKSTPKQKGFMQMGSIFD